MMQHIDGSIESGRRPEAAPCIFHIKRDTTQVFAVGDPDRLSDVLADVARANQDALVVTTSAVVFSLRRAILEFATKNRLPGVYPFRIYADDRD
jgi:hypothetical protein